MTNKLLDIIDNTWWIHCTNEQRERLKSKALNGIMYMVEDVPSVESVDRLPVSDDDSPWEEFVQRNQPRSCRFWDCGFCCHNDSPKSGECVGIGQCQIWEER